MSLRKKYYVVWQGREPGIYGSWVDCERQVKGVEGAVYKSFKTQEEAEEALYSSPTAYIKERVANSDYRTASIEKAPVNPPTNRTDTVLPLPLEVTADALAVDAACSGNPGKMEYRGVYLKTGQVVFHYGPVHGTNNIGEFLAIVHALALLKNKGVTMTVYSDSSNALLWIKNRKCKTTLVRNARTEELHRLIERAERWLETHNYKDIPLRKWETARWGEIPADFGRK